MGLDSVELIMTIEDKFGIAIPDTECEQIYTVQDMADFKIWLILYLKK
jgi:acyl carrier protein